MPHYQSSTSKQFDAQSVKRFFFKRIKLSRVKHSFATGNRRSIHTYTHVHAVRAMYSVPNTQFSHSLTGGFLRCLSGESLPKVTQLEPPELEEWDVSSALLACSLAVKGRKKRCNKKTRAPSSPKYSLIIQVQDGPV